MTITLVIIIAATPGASSADGHAEADTPTTSDAGNSSAPSPYGCRKIVSRKRPSAPPRHR
jgi:hypothetical protein